MSQPHDNHAEDSSGPDSSVDAVQINLLDFTVRAGGRTLLDNTSASFPAGQVSLILGCSGVGKSVLLRILAGLIESDRNAIQWSGLVEHRRGNVTAGEHVSGSRTAVVFQNFALLDELSPEENVQIALDHSSALKRRERQQRTRDLLDHLAVPTDRPTSVLSGGQQQRLAIARAIAMDTDVVLYDEPTSGLDTATAERVATLIRDTQQDFQRTTLVVTHDFRALRPIADQIFVLNHRTQQLEQISPDAWDQLQAAIGTPPPVDAEPVSVPGRLSRLGQSVVGFMTRSGQGLEELLLLPWALLPIWRSLKWGLRSTRHYLRLVAGPSACAYIVIAGIIIGFVAQDFIFRYLPFRQYTEPLLVENLLHATGFSLYRFLVPILCTILIAARSGAAVAADVGSKVYGNQMDAMQTIGIHPRRHLRTPILYAFLLGTPLLTFLSYAAASLTAAVAFLATHSEQGIAFWDAHFHKELRDPSSLLFYGTDWLIAKLLCCAVGVGMIAWNCGVSPKRSATEISTGVTRTILWSTLLVLAVHFVFSLLEFKAPT